MNKRTISRILAVGVFFATVMFTVNAMAQATARPAAPAATSQAPTKGATSTKTARNEPPRYPACRQIYDECQKLGFIVGEAKQDNGLWKDCFDPVANGGQATRDGKPIQVPVSPKTVQECREHRAKEHKGAQGMKQGGQVKPGTQTPKM